VEVNYFTVMNAVRIEKLVFGGYGLGRDDGGVVLIPGTASGELVEYADDGSKGGTRVGRAVEIIEPSPYRRDAPCVYAGTCGGCDWIHLYYSEQVRCKKEIFLDCADRIGKFERPDDIDVFTANEFGYRMRAQIKIDSPRGSAGFFRRKSNDVVRVDSCPLLTDEINGVLTELNSGAARRVGGDVKNIMVLAGKNTASRPVISGLTRADTEIDAGGIKFLADGGSFFQSNKFLLETLGGWARGFIRGKHFLDLYGGIGFFSLFMADNFESGVLAENVAAQVRAAEQNFAANGKSHLTGTVIDVERVADLDKLAKSTRPDCVIVDPPRPGLVKNVRKWLTDTAPPAILYVSCNPSTFARDAGALVGGGYKLERWALFDLYPNTHHMESAAVFRRR